MSFILNVVMLSVTNKPLIESGILLNVVMPSVVMLIVVMLNVVVPLLHPGACTTKLFVLVTRPGPNAINFFVRNLRNFRNRQECLSLTSFSSIV
jgi:hypothetical protein